MFKRLILTDLKRIKTLFVPMLIASFFLAVIISGLSVLSGKLLYSKDKQEPVDIGIVMSADSSMSNMAYNMVSDMKSYSSYTNIIKYQDKASGIKAVESGELKALILLPDDVLPILYQTATDNRQTILTYDNECILTENPNDPYVQKEAFLNKMQVRRVENFLQEIPLPLPKCLIVGEPEQLMKTEAELSLRLQRQISVYRSEPYFLELVPLGIDKARSIAVLSEKLGITREEVAAMGDGYNDLSMIKYAGLGIAMDNAQEPVKAAADYIAPSNDEDGVAIAVERYFLHAF